MTQPGRSVLVILATPRERADSETIRRLGTELARHGRFSVTTWYLRDLDAEAPASTWVVDRLRTARSAQALANLLGPGAALRWNGIRLRHQLRSISPDVVILDGGRGERVVASRRGRHRLVALLRSDQTPDDDLEPSGPTTFDAVIAPAGRTLDAPARNPSEIVLDLPVVAHDPSAIAYRSSARRAEARRHLGIPDDHPLVVGWGDDGWLDGVDLFIRTLWAIEAKQGVQVEGVWLGRSVDQHEAGRFAAEAGRCGVGDRFHSRPDTGIEARLAADVALLPYRSPADGTAIRDAIASGLPVVTTPAVDLQHALVRVVDHLDVEAAAAAVVQALETTRDQNIQHARSSRLHIDDWCDLDATQWVERFATATARRSGTRR